MSHCVTVAAVISALLTTSAWADDPPQAAAQGQAQAPQLSQQELFKKLENDLTNVKLTGKFTIAGKEDRDPRNEEYTITSALKLPEGDVWLLKARIKYGDKDVTVPLPLEIKWAGDTPMISMTDFTIPQLGTFSARVVIYEGRYAGTWQHGPVGGHLYGKLEKVEAEKPAEKDK